VLVVRIAAQFSSGRDGRAYILLGGPQPGLTVSDVVEVLDLR
jgi:hypothetical protein